jgi:hypothetical protein
VNLLCRLGLHRLQAVPATAVTNEVEESVGEVVRITTQTTWTYSYVRACTRCPFDTAPIITIEPSPLRVSEDCEHVERP